MLLVTHIFGVHPSFHDTLRLSFRLLSNSTQETKIQKRQNNKKTRKTNGLNGHARIVFLSVYLLGGVLHVIRREGGFNIIFSPAVFITFPAWL